MNHQKRRNDIEYAMGCLEVARDRINNSDKYIRETIEILNRILESTEANASDEIDWAQDIINKIVNK